MYAKSGSFAQVHSLFVSFDCIAGALPATYFLVELAVILLWDAIVSLCYSQVCVNKARSGT